MKMSESTNAKSEAIPSWPKVSVITVVRNDRDGLVKTIASVAVQDYPTLEYIVIDGASIDGTLEKIHESEQVIDIWTSEPDLGLYDAMNKGKAVATGERAIFLNAGDILATTDALTKLLSPLPSADIVVCGNVLLSYGSNHWSVPRRRNGRIARAYVPHHQTILYPRSFFKNNDYDLQFRIVADVDYNRRAMGLCVMEYRDVDLVSSILGGFTFTMYRSLKGALTMYRERQMLYRKYAVKYSRAHASRLAVLVFMKYLSVKIGGVALATGLMRWKLKLGAIFEVRF